MLHDSLPIQASANQSSTSRFPPSRFPPSGTPSRSSSFDGYAAERKFQPKVKSLHSSFLTPDAGGSGSGFETQEVTITRFMCKLCQKAFNHRPSLLSHQISVHGRQKNKRGRPVMRIPGYDDNWRLCWQFLVTMTIDGYTWQFLVTMTIDGYNDNSWLRWQLKLFN